MKKLVLCVGVLVMAVAQVQAISQGPGGRLYMTQIDTTVGQITLKSLVLDEDWDPVGTNFATNGVIGDNNAANDHAYGGISPELIGAPVGDAGYRDFIMGVYYNNTPVSLFTGEQTMDVIQVTPYAGGNSPDVIAEGKASSTGSGWYGGTPKACTDRGMVALPDPEGGFLNEGEILTHGSDDGSNKNTLQVNFDSESDGDCTDDGALLGEGDYGDYARRIGDARDYEFLENRLYCSCGYWNEDEHTGIAYYERAGDGSITSRDPTTGFAKKFVWKDSTMALPESLEGFSMSGSQGVAMNKVTIADGQYAGEHHATYVLCTLRTWLDQPELHALALCVDLNDDGDAMDNDIGEITWILRSDDLNSLIDSDRAQWNEWTDMEIVTNPWTGKKFLLVLRDDTDDASEGHAGDYLLVLELEDNGDWVGGPDGMKMVCNTGVPAGCWFTSSLTGWDTVGTEIEFDPNPIPEPATLLLIGTGALGLVGYIRRRRMN